MEDVSVARQGSEDLFKRHSWLPRRKWSDEDLRAAELLFCHESGCRQQHLSEAPSVFADEATAIAAGYRPCGNCMRDQYKAWRANQPQR
jgi:hypothetical protein